MEEFESSGEVLPETLIAASASYVKSVRDRGADVVVLDSLFPYLPSLLAWGSFRRRDRRVLRASSRACSTRCWSSSSTSPGRRAARFAARRAERVGPWLADHIARRCLRSRVTPRASTWADTVAYYEAAATRSASLLERAPWPVVRIDADQGAATALTDAAGSDLRALRRVTACFGLQTPVVGRGEHPVRDSNP